MSQNKKLKQEFSQFTPLYRKQLNPELTDHGFVDCTQEVKDWIEQQIAEAEERVFLEIENELTKPKWNTDMSGWDIVPQLMAKMQILRAKYVSDQESEGGDTS